ncbi:MAG TPA: hypothetical protein VMT88_02945, partial [Actinomycetes bacterium]|nr:hypothetical protein [Actinomycetes bacterium]
MQQLAVKSRVRIQAARTRAIDSTLNAAAGLGLVTTAAIGDSSAFLWRDSAESTGEFLSRV